MRTRHSALRVAVGRLCRESLRLLGLSQQRLLALCICSICVVRARRGCRAGCVCLCVLCMMW